MLGPTEIPPSVAADESQFRDWRFCQKCQIYQGPLTAHCNDCKVCIDEVRSGEERSNGLRGSNIRSASSLRSSL